MNTLPNLPCAVTARRGAITLNLIAKLGLIVPLLLGFPFSSARGATIDSPRSTALLLVHGTEVQRTELANALGLMLPSNRPHHDQIPCTLFDQASTERVTLARHTQYDVMKSVSSICGYTYLTIFRKSKSTWRYLQTISLWSKDKTPQVTFESLIVAGEKDIVASNYETDYGSGILQTNITIWRLHDNRLHVILDEPTKVNFAIPAGPTAFENTEQSEDSTFLFQPDVNGTAKTKILQKQIIRQNGARIIRWWQFTWDPSMNRFRRQPTWR